MASFKRGYFFKMGSGNNLWKSAGFEAGWRLLTKIPLLRYNINYVFFLDTNLLKGVFFFLV